MSWFLYCLYSVTFKRYICVRVLKTYANTMNLYMCTYSVNLLIGYHVSIYGVFWLAKLLAGYHILMCRVLWLVNLLVGYDVLMYRAF